MLYHFVASTNFDKRHLMTMLCVVDINDAIKQYLLIHGAELQLEFFKAHLIFAIKLSSVCLTMYQCGVI